MTVMATQAIEFLENAIQREKQLFIGITDRPPSNTVELKWIDLMQGCDPEILSWFGIFFFKLNRREALENIGDIVFHGHGVRRKVIIKLSSPMARDVISGSHVHMENLVGIDFGFWPLKSPDPKIAATNVKKRAMKPFSALKGRQKRHRLAAYRSPINELLSSNNDVDQSEILLHYSNEKAKKRNSNSPLTSMKIIDDLLVTFRYALKNSNQNKAISVLSTIRSSGLYTLQELNKEYFSRDDFKVTSYLWTKANKWFKKYGSSGDIGDEILYEESHKTFDPAR